MNWPAFARRIRVPMGFAFAALYLWLAKPQWWSVLAGAGIAAVGLWLRALAAGHVRKSAEITTSGPYGYTRNPLYLGSLIIAVGFALAARNWLLALLFAIFFVAVYYPVIYWEEKYLRANFSEFAAYSASVPRLFPKWRSESTQPNPFSRELYLKHREYNALIGSVAMLAALAIKLVWYGR
jgi:protein-S-isoprenylcysteine O-methyltransferase Ste14